MPGIVSLVFLGMDWVIGIIYRGSGLSLGWTLYAAAEDFVFFTAGSELLLMFCIGMLWAMVSDKAKVYISGRGKVTRMDYKPPSPTNTSTQIANSMYEQRLLRTNGQTNEPKSTQIVGYAKMWKVKHGSYPSPTKVADVFHTSKGYVSDVLKKEFDDYS